MLQREANEGDPINKPRAYEEDQRQRKKFFQKKCWFKKGGYDVPLFVDQIDHTYILTTLSRQTLHLHIHVTVGLSSLLLYCPRDN